jgi:hypothetical protein
MIRFAKQPVVALERSDKVAAGKRPQGHAFAPLKRGYPVISQANP